LVPRYQGHHYKSYGSRELRWPGPGFFGLGPLTTVPRAILAYRRLARLAPHHFNSAVVEGERRAREVRRRWMATWEPALEKAYGPSTPALPPGQVRQM